MSSPATAWLAWSPSKDPSLGTPGPDQVHTLGTLATIHRLFRTPDGRSDY